MRTLLIACSLALAVVTCLNGYAVSADSSWPMSGHDPQATNFNSGERALDAKNATRLHRAWAYEGQVSGIISAGSRMYVAVPAGVLVLQPKTGKRVTIITLHELRLKAALQAVDLGYSRGVLVVATHEAIVAVDAASRRFLWRFPVTFTTGVLVAGGTVFTGSYCFNGCPTHALDLHTGRRVWTNKAGGLLQALVHGYLYEGLLWHGSCQNRVYDAATGSLVAILPSCTQPVGDGPDTYAEIFPKNVGQSAVLARIIASGRVVWKVTVGRPDIHPLAVAYHTLFGIARTGHDTLIAVSTSRRRVLWSRPMEGSVSLIVANHLLFVVHPESRWIDVMSTAAGRWLGRFRVPAIREGDTLFGAIVANGTLYAWLPSGLVTMAPQGKR